MIAIIGALTSIAELRSTGGSDGRRYAVDLVKPRTVFEIHLIHEVLRPPMKFLRQIEQRRGCLDNFSIALIAARAKIEQTMTNFDYDSLNETLNSVKNFHSV
ncbi:unnamed protein product [Didymodactylos carnosus]|uniref:Uncharacterized protein n=1 Tax=Didymodactylos carnosus TaxID=1234261 RepID=A0A814ENV9_9BILA|nr:unnamed protein product [Didymodactylos carnosus]CAF0973886.1 unnamed protein product [Didymodactylos carnosus]CAF3511056.1 unnamed protein product [Didymodactylos carnosus]CAF3746795.1 unnamed protein product [Didymodactylos carnosus]